MAPSVTETEPAAQISLKQKEENGNSDNAAARHEEYQYLDLIREILETGEHRPDRYDSSLAMQLYCFNRPLTDHPSTLQDWHGHNVPLRTTPSEILTLLPLRRRHPTPPHHQARLPARRDRRAALVRVGRDVLAAPLGSGRQDLGRQRIA